MINITKLINRIITGIDRIEFSMPIKNNNLLTRHINKEGIKINHYKSKDERYWILEYRVIKHKVFIKYKIQSSYGSSLYERMYITVHNPNTEVQNYLKEIFTDISRGNFEGLSGILINQFEVSYDIYSHKKLWLNKIQQFFEHHLLVKFLKPESYNKYKTTNYIGRNGSVRKGSKGLRGYLKHENNKDFYRIEMQYNRPYILKNDVTVHSLPLNPLSFHSLDHIELLDNFSAKGIRNLSKSLLRKKKITKTTYADFDTLHRKEMDNLKSKVLGGGRGPKRTVYKQLSVLKSIKKKSGLSVNHKQYFTPLYDVQQLICCLADVSYKENCCSKRMLFCQA